jgi:hypothetical protein
MKRRTFLGLAAASMAVAACGAPPVRMSPRTPTPPPAQPAVATPTPVPPQALAVAPIAGLADRLLVRETIAGVTQIAGIDPGAGSKRFVLPMGQPTSDGRHWLALSPSTDATVIELFSVIDGTLTAKLSVPGTYHESALSHADHWLLLAQPLGTGPGSTTQLAVVDLQKAAVVDTPTVPGLFHVDAIDASGLRLYLIEPRPEKRSNAYQVMLYDRIEGGLSKNNPIADKRSGQKIMSGTKVRHAWSTSGEWLYSLYQDPGTGGDGAFVHALNVAQKFAVCIDLPARDTSLMMLQHYALAASPMTHRYFAINPALQSLSYFGEGDWNAISNDFQIPGAHGQEARAQATPDYNNSLVSPDGRTLYAGSSRGILRIPIKYSPMQPSDAWLADQSVLSIGATPNALYALLDGTIRRLVALDPVSGAVLGDLTGLVSEPTGIEQVLPAT